MNHPERQLRAIAELAAAAADAWATYEGTEAALAQAPLRSTLGPGSSGGDISDPVGNLAATGHERYYETAGNIAEALGLMRFVQRRQAEVRRSHPQTAREIDAALSAARCTGVVGEDPTCTRNAVKNVTYRGTPQPTCWACIKRDQRARDAIDQAG